MKRLLLSAWVLLGLYATLLLVSPGPVVPPGQAASPLDIVRQAWQQASQADGYQFRSRLEQTLYPAKTLANAGQYAATDRLIIEGETNRAAGSLLLRLRRPEDVPERVTEIRLADGQTSARVGGGDWQPLEKQSSDLFGPGQDPLNYLAAVKNVRPAEGNAPADLSLLLAAERFTFEIDGPAYAALMRDELQAHLLARGELPPGVTVDVADQYRAMTAEGELWLDEAGLPLRLQLNIVFPPEADGAQTAARLQTEFFDFVGVDHSQLTLPARVERALSRFDWRTSGAHVALFLGGIGLMGGALLVQRRRRRLFYNTTVSLVILSMVATPLLQSAQAANFYQRQTARQTEYNAQRAEQLAQMETAAPPPVWDSTLDPLSRPAPELPPANLTGADSAEPLLASALFSTSNCSSDDGADSDSDGLVDTLEARYGSNCEVADTDSDGLSDALEVLQLGTDPTLADSDGDGLPDPVEVAGGDRLSGYSDPLNVDTNYDGIPDGVECQPLTQVNPALDATCPDTDNDSIKDLLDNDNDGDGVLDSDDMSPYGHLGSNNDPFTDDAPFALQVDGVEADYPLFVDFQLRTINPEHLTYAYNVLDWPSGDTKGQVQRVKDTTFENTQNLAARISGARGDMQLVPLLEITIPDADSSYGNLPTLSNPVNLTPSTPITSWLDVEQLTPYGISVNRASADTTDLVVYVPLSPNTDISGGEQVALSGRMLYRPAAGVTAWGKAHQVRLLWLVRMLVDVCDNPNEDDDYCQQPEHRQDGMTVVHSYYDDWYLTGLKVSEDHGLNVALAFEDPATDTNLTYDQNLWQLASGLNRVFMGGRATDNARDLTISTIKQRFDRDSNGGVSAAERWGIPQNALRVETFAYPHEGYMMHIAMTETVRLLETHFGGHQEVIPTILLAQEQQSRLFNLDAQDTLNGTHSFQASLTGTTLDTFAGLVWTPFVFDPSTQTWATEPLADYETYFKATLAAVPFFAPGDTPDSKLISAGRQHIAWGYYQTLAAGSINLVQSDQTIFTDPTADVIDPTMGVSDAQLADKFQNGDGVLSKVGQVGQLMGSLAHLSVSAVDPNQDIYRLLGIWLAGGDSSQISWTAVARRALATWEDTPVDNSVSIGAAVTIHPESFGAETKWQLAARAFSVIKTAVKVIRLMRAASVAKLNDIMAFGKWGAIFFIVTIIVIWGVFLYQKHNERDGSAAIGQAKAYAISATVLATYLLVLSLTGLGVVVLFLVILDLMLIINCWLGRTDYLCAGVSGWLTEQYADLIYDLDPHVDINDTNRLQIKNVELNFENEKQGFQVNNKLDYVISLTNTLQYDGNTSTNLVNPSFPGLDTAKESTFAYKLQSSETAIDDDIDRGSMTDEWAVMTTTTDTKITSTILMTATNSFSATLSQAGINQNKPLYLTEGFAVPATEHWDVWIYFPPAGLIRYKDSKEVTIYYSHHTNLQDLSTYDVFPPTLSQFRQLHSVDNGQYALDWANNDHLNLSFPAMWDADGDGLGNRHAGGTDPNDSRWDSDGDGLSDAFELNNGLSPTKADFDNDGLNDREELIYGTPPYLADTDGDGLTDAQELAGWSVVYSDTLTTWTWSNPFVYDTDGDGLNDAKERLFGFNPRALSNPKVLDYQVQIDRADGRTELGTIFGNGDTFDYTSTIHSRLANRDAQGLLIMNPAPAALTVQSQPQNFFLSPYGEQETTLTGEVTVNASPTTPSGKYLLSQTAGAIIRDPQTGSTYAEVFLPFNGTGGNGPDDMADLSDYSGQLVKNNGKLNPPDYGACYSVSASDRKSWTNPARTGVQCMYTQIHLSHPVDLRANNNNDYAIAIWVYDGDGSNSGIIFQGSNSNNDLVKLEVNKGTYQFTHRDSGGETTLSWTLPQITWTDVVVVKHGNTLQVYHNGNPGPSTITPSGSFRAPANVQITDGNLITLYLDDFYLFSRALSHSEVAQLYASSLPTDPKLNMTLDDAQGKDRFENLGTAGAGSCSGSSCPTTGLPGIINQAAFFDGDDRIELPLVSYKQDNFTLSAWVKWDGSLDKQFIFYNGNSTKNNGYGLGLNNGELQLIKENDWNNPVAPSSPIKLTANRWQQVILAASANGNWWTIYVDGIEHDIFGPGEKTLQPKQPTDKTTIGAATDGSYGFRGGLDDIRFLEDFLYDNPDISNLYSGGPIWQLHLDEAPGSTTFADTRGDHNAFCAACPASGQAGQIFGAAQFSGGQSIITGSPFFTEVDNFTMMAWVMWNGRGGQDQTILYNGRKENSELGDGYGLTLSDGKITIFNAGFNAMSIVTSYKLHPKQWYHLAVTRKANYWQLYINGSAYYSTYKPDNDPTPPSDQIGLHVGDNFHGVIDEPALYQRALTGSEVRAMYNAQNQWIQEESHLGITVDNASPTTELLSYNPDGLNYRKNEPVLLSVAAVDDYAGVDRVTVTAAGNPLATEKGVASEHAWYAWFPAPGGGNPGEGAHTITVSAADRLGNTAAAQSYTLYVDGTPPNVSITDPGTLLGVSAPPGQPTARQVRLTGAVSDPSLSGTATPGSGPAAVYVSLYQPTGDLAGDSWQAASITGTTWTLDYLFNHLNVAGAYTVTAAAADQLGNRATAAPVVIQIDSQPPTATLQTSSLPTSTIVSGNLTLTGAAVEQPLTYTVAGLAGVDLAFTPHAAGSAAFNDVPLSGLTAHWPLDDSPALTGTLTLRDISGNALHGRCDTCPALGPSGHVQSAARFDGINDAVTLPTADQLSLTNHDFTVSAWVKLADTSGDQVILGTDTQLTNQGLRLMVSNGTPVLGFYDNDLTGSQTIQPGQWYHLVWRYTQSTNEQAIFVNGVLDTSEAGHAPFTGTGPVYLGRAWAGTAFNGLLDEVKLYNRPLSIAEIAGLYRGSGPLLWLKLDAPSFVDQATLADASGWEHHSQLSSRDSVGKAVPGAVGPFALSFDGVDDTVLLPSAVSNFTPPQFSAAFWLKIGDTFGYDTILAKGNVAGDVWTFQTTSSSNGQGRGVVLRVGAFSLPAYSWNDTDWHHVTGVYNGSQQILYVDGVEVGRSTVGGFSDTSIATLSLGANQSRPSAALDGQLDDIRYYPRAITAGEVQDLAGSNWRAATMSASGSGVRTADWSFALPAGLEGLYRLNLQPTDQLGNRGLQDSKQWAGLIDTRAPHVTIINTNVHRGWICQPGPFSLANCRWSGLPNGVYTYTYQIEDFNLSTVGLNASCDGTASPLVSTYYQSPWYRAMSGGDNRLYQIDGSCNNSQILPANFQITACDAAGNCATATASTAANATLIQQTDPDLLYTEVVSPTAYSVITHTNPVSLTTWGVALNYLQAMTVSIDSVPTYSATWTQGEAITATGLLTDHLFAEGTHQIESQVSDWAGGVTRHTITVTVDTLPPQLALNTAPLTRTDFHPNGLLDISGLVTDSNAITAVQVRLSPDGGWSSPANLTGNRWLASLILPAAAPDGVSYTLNARATDIAGRETVVTSTVWVDVVAPPPVALTLRADGVPVSPGETVRTAPANLTLSWGDNSFAADVLWHTRASHQDWLTATVTSLPAGGATSAAFSPGEAEQVEVTLVRRDALGNQRSQRWGVLTVDAPTTPDFVSLTPAGGTRQPEQSWLNSDCTLIGVDRRADRRVSQFNARDGEQRFYATWDDAGLRLAWQGANWAGDGNLFVYLDTQTGGATQAYNPFTDGHTVYLPGNFAADTLVWVQNETAAALLHWDGASWASFPLTADQLHFKGDQTDLYLSFADLGLANPATTPVKLLSFAAEEDALALWAIFPTANPLNSPLVSDHAPFVSGPDSFGLSRAYAWSGLGAGVCPNAAYPDIDLTFDLIADPTGTEYAFLDDNLHFLWAELMNGKSADVSSLFTHTDASHPPLADGQAISYTLTYENRGTANAANVAVDLTAVNGLQLSGGNRTISVGDVAPGGSGSINFQGQVDLSGATHDWANLEALVYSEAHPVGGPPLEWLWLDHQIDHTPPISLSIQQPVSVVGPGTNLFSGSVYDASPPVSLALVASGAGQMTCPPAQADGRWRCSWNATAANGGQPPADGQVFLLNLHAADAFGQTASGASIPFVVDSTPPDITVSTATLRLSNSYHYLSGQVSDNHELGAVSVCWLQGACGAATLADDGAWAYALPLPAGLDGVTHTVTISATDAVGNLSQSQVEVLVDTVPPQFSANQLLTAGIWLTGTLTVLAGSVSDGSGPIEQINVLVTGPDGRYYTLGVDPEAGAWTFDLRPDLGGTYTLWATAQDAAGNRSVQGPYFVEAVVEPTLTKSSNPGDSAAPGNNIDYLLEIRNTSGVTIEQVSVTDPLPPYLTPLSASGGAPCLRAETRTLEWQSLSLAPHSAAYLSFSAALTTTGIYSGAVISNTASLTTPIWGLRASNTAWVTIRQPITITTGPLYFPLLTRNMAIAAGAEPLYLPLLLRRQGETVSAVQLARQGPYLLYFPMISAGQPSLPLCR